MKKYSILLVGILAMAGCDEFENSAEESQITYLPVIEMTGSDVELACDAAAYTDPGAVAREGSSQIELQTTITGQYFGGTSVTGPDVYEVLYSALNQDSIPAAAFRHVYWPPCNGDFVTSIAGVYTADVKRNGAITPQYMGLGPILVRDLGNNQYAISDAIGGYYDFGRVYGYTYASTGMTVTANSIAGNSFTFTDPDGVGAFGGVNQVKSFSVNPATKQITFTTSWDAGYDFEVVLTQVD